MERKASNQRKKPPSVLKPPTAHVSHRIERSPKSSTGWYLCICVSACMGMQRGFVVCVLWCQLFAFEIACVCSQIVNMKL